MSDSRARLATHAAWIAVAACAAALTLCVEDESEDRARDLGADMKAAASVVSPESGEQPSSNEPDTNVEGELVPENALAEVASLEWELETLREKVDQLERRDEPEARENGPSPAADLDESEHTGRVILEWDAALRNSLSSEAIDPAWAQEATHQIDQAFRFEEFAEIVVDEIDCRTTVCKIEVELAGDSALDGLTMLPQRIPWAGGGFLHTDGAHGVIFVSRDGFGLPAELPPAGGTE